MIRQVEPEILETLAPDDPAAIVGRADLRLINAIMGNHRWLVRQALKHIQPGWRILELGAGDSTLAKLLLKAGACQPQDLWGVDLVSRPTNWPAQAHWIEGDMNQLPELPEAEVIIASLVLHHLDHPKLQQLGQRWPCGCRLLLASEPARYPLHLLQGRALSLAARLNHVTRHDILVSVNAGFRKNELLDSLGLPAWQGQVTESWLGAYRVVASPSSRLA